MIDVITDGFVARAVYFVERSLTREREKERERGRECESRSRRESLTIIPLPRSDMEDLIGLNLVKEPPTRLNEKIERI